MKKRDAFFCILIVLAFAAVAALVFVLVPGAEPDTPAVRLPAVTEPDSPVVMPDTDAVGDRVIRIDTDTVQTAISMLARTDSYSRTLTVQHFWSGGTSSEEILVWVHGQNMRVTIRGKTYDSEKNILIKGQEKWIWYSEAKSAWHGAARDGDADAYQTLLTYEDVLALDKSALRDAGYTEYDGETCIYVRYADGELGYESLCYISVGTGLLMGTETYDGDVLIYSMTSSHPDISTPDEEIFAEP